MCYKVFYYYLLLDSGITVVVAPDYLGDVYQRRWKMVRMDNHMGLAELTKDFESGHFIYRSFNHLVILLGRADLLCGCQFSVVLAALMTAIRKVCSSGRVWFTGPIARCHDKGVMLKDIRSARDEVQAFVSKENNVRFVNLGAILKDENSVRDVLLKPDGLTLNGRREFWRLLPV